VTNRITLELSAPTAFAGGHAFGDTGAYERLRGRAHFAVDPLAPAQAGVTDIQLAPRDAEGLVHFSADLVILRPTDPSKGNRRLFHDWGNRGNCRALQFFNDALHSNDPSSLEHAGNGFLFRRGYSYVWSAWQGDVLPGSDRMTMNLQVASNADGSPVTGLVRQEYITDYETDCFPLSSRASTRSHPTVSLDTSTAQLTKRRYPDDPRVEIPHDQWQFAQLQSGRTMSGEGGTAEIGIAPSDRHIYMASEFQPGWIYELVYEGRDPLVSGLGHVSVRDLVSFFKRGGADAAGAASPFGKIEKAYGFGRSQTGRCIRDFVYQGFNEDANSAQVFDGLIPHVAGAGLMWMNHRFANMVVAAGQQYEDHHNIADRFPFSYAESTDHLTGATDAILKRPATDPLIMHSQTGTEYWQRRGSLAHTDTQGNDLAQPDGVRIYFWASSQHNANPRQGAPAKGACHHLNNVVDTSMLFRAMLDALDRWATDGTPPPDSRMPRRSDGTLITHAQWLERFPTIPGALKSTGPSAMSLLDFGPEAQNGVLTKEPPEVLAKDGYAVLIPAVDSDGNDLGGVRAPMVQAPLATYCGWNVRAAGYGTGANHEFTGSTIPLPVTESERRMTGDPRPSVAERFADVAAYQAAIREAAEALVADGLMLEEDVERAVAKAADWSAPRFSITN
jgi:hypothetical protein